MARSVVVSSELSVHETQNSSRWSPLVSPGLLQRTLLLAILFALELTAISIWLDNDALAHRSEFLTFLHRWGAWILRGAVGFATLFVAFSYMKHKTALAQVSSTVLQIPIGWGLLAAHGLAMVAFAVLSVPLYGGVVAGLSSNLLAVSWLAAGLAGIAFAALALVPLGFWLLVIRITGPLWAYALLAVILACVVGNASRALWQPFGQLTFALVNAFLRPFVSGIVADPATMNLGTHRFAVQIAPECSGFEGAGLMLAFGLVWLSLFHRELRFPQALLLLPAGVILIFVLNAARIAVLILIGNSGAERVALGGFHSQAGWISFNVAALAFCVAARRVPWLTTRHGAQDTAAERLNDNPTAAYLLPFVAILAVGMISTAASADFEWFYPLRFGVAAAVLWFFRRTYSQLDWRFGWLGPAIGTLVFFLWVSLDRSFHVLSAMPSALAAAPAGTRLTWLTFRILAAVVTVPIAEELAFRGFLIRRLISAQFESIDLRRFTWVGLLISSVAFGVLHGQHWFAGTLAGLLYAAALLRRGRIGEAVAAHATTNALLAAYVLLFQKWHLW